MTLVAPQPLKPRPRQKSIISLETFLGGPKHSSMHTRSTSHSHSRQSSWGVVVAASNGLDQPCSPQKSATAGYTNFYGEYPIHIYRANDAVEELFQKMNGTNILDDVPSKDSFTSVSSENTLESEDMPVDMSLEGNSNGDINSDFYSTPHSPVARISRNPIILNSSFRG